MSNRRYVWGALLIACVLFVMLVSPLSAQVRQPFEWIFAKRLTVDTTSTLTGDVTASSDVSVGDDLNVAGTLGLTQGANVAGLSTFNGDVVANGYIASTDMLYLIPADPITVTAGGIITPTGAFVELTAAGAVGAELAACGDGQVTVFLNTANQTITISDTGSVRLAGNAALGQWDTLTVIGSGVSCNEIARANN